MHLPDFATVDRPPRAVALDLDGTALNSSSRLSARTSTAVLRLINAGIPVVIATARPERVIPILVGPEIAARCSVVHMSGAAGTGRRPLAGEVWNPIRPDDAVCAWEIVNGSNSSPRMTMEIDGRRFAVNHESDVNELWTFNSATPDMILPVEEAIEIGPAKVSVNGVGEDLSDIVDDLTSALPNDTVVVPAVDNSFINIHSATARKSAATEQLIASNDIALEDVLSFGDDLPDVDLMLHTGWPVAVSNAIPQVKSAARFLTASNDEDGVALVLEQLLSALGKSG